MFNPPLNEYVGNWEDSLEERPDKAKDEYTVSFDGNDVLFNGYKIEFLNSHEYGLTYFANGRCFSTLEEAIEYCDR